MAQQLETPLTAETERHINGGEKPAPISGHGTTEPRPMRRKSPKSPRPPEFDCIALLLQGGGALGAYQAGVYQALAEADLQPHWVAGISIGGINAAIIAGNPPESRVDRLREFWELVTQAQLLGLDSWIAGQKMTGDITRSLLNQASASAAMFQGVQHFFKPRLPPPWFLPDGALGATSFYDTAPLRGTLERLIDFDRINSDDIRLSMGTVNVTTGNFVYFDTTTHTIGPEHVMASGALPPGFPPIEIEGEYYWDGGLVSNTPLQWVVQEGPSQDTLIFQVDLWSARGKLPGNLAEVATRQKEIQFSSRTRAATDWFKRVKSVRGALAKLLPQLPDALKNTPEARLLNAIADRSVYNIVHLIYRARNYEGHSKDCEFSRLTMEEHWRAGYNDTIRTLRHPEVLERPDNVEGLMTFDLAVDGRE